MDKQRDDILQIRKYLNGELDARAMHDLERQAQDDPFLMEALEGFEKAGTDQQKNLDELSVRLQQRVAKKEGLIIPWRFVSAAASVLIILTIGVLWLNSRKPELQPKTAMVIAPPQQKAPDSLNNPQAQTDIAVKAKPAPLATITDKYPRKQIPAKQERIAQYDANVISNDNMISSEPPVAETQTSSPAVNNIKEKAPAPLNEVVASEYAAQKKTQGDTVTNTSKGYFSVDKALQGRAAGVQVSPNRYAGRTYVTGVVTSFDNGQPIPGAVVKIEGQKFGVVTDANGKFVLPNAPSKATLAVNFIGYDTQRVTIDNKDSLKIAMKPSDQSLNEVIVVGYGAVKKNDDEETKSFIAAHPIKGWKALNAYLKEKAIMPDGTKGKVKLSFTVDSRGNLSDFKIITSLSKAADEQAINLIENGPDWTGASNGKPQKVKLTVDFH